MGLPDAFADLEPFVAKWALHGMAQRLQARLSSTPAERLAFYGAMQPRAEAVMAHLQQHSLDDLPPASEALLQLMLSLAEVSLTEEVLGQAREAEHALGNRRIEVRKELDGR